MKDLYQRLVQSGFDARFIRNAVLPDWWEDCLASVPSNRAIAETAMARLLGFQIAALRDPGAPLTLPPVSNFRLKRSRNTTASQVRPAVVVAERLARLVVESLAESSPAFSAVVSAQDARCRILEQNPYVELKSLVDFCWEHGVVVIQVDPRQLPRCKKFHGVTMFIDHHPVIVLAFGSDSPARLAFHLAHEAGHLFCRHVRVGAKPLVDSDIDQVTEDRDEKRADAFAMELLTGKKSPAFQQRFGLTGEALASWAQAYGRANAIDPGMVALIYGRSANRWGVAQRALQSMGKDRGAGKVLADAVAEHLNFDQMPESTERLFTSLSPTTA